MHRWWANLKAREQTERAQAHEEEVLLQDLQEHLEPEDAQESELTSLAALMGTQL